MACVTCAGMRGFRCLDSSDGSYNRGMMTHRKEGMGVLLVRASSGGATQRERAGWTALSVAATYGLGSHFIRPFSARASLRSSTTYSITITHSSSLASMSQFYPALGNTSTCMKCKTEGLRLKTHDSRKGWAVTSPQGCKHGCPPCEGELCRSDPKEACWMDGGK